MAFAHFKFRTQKDTNCKHILLITNVFSMRKWGATEAAILFYTEEGQWPEALNLISILEKPLDLRMVLAECTCLFNQGMYERAIEVVVQTEDRETDVAELLMIKGKSLYRSDEFESARVAFEKADELAPTVDSRRWIQRSIVRAASLRGGDVRRVIRIEPRIAQGSAKREWWQSRVSVGLSVFVKGAKANQVRVRSTSTTVIMIVGGQMPMEIAIKLANEIVAGETIVQVTQKKIEIKMKKAPNSPAQWATFEEEPSKQ